MFNLSRNVTMKSAYVSAIALAIAALSAGQTLADDAAPKTREQVRAELLEAQRTGDLIGDGETGMKLNQLYPHRYPAAAVAEGKTRAEVRAELGEAQRTGNIVADGETGRKFNELFPAQYPAQVVAAG
jgi:hypothetical protein